MKYLKIILLLISLSIIPINSKEVILGGDSVGIKLEYDGLLVVGYYNIDNQHINKHLQINDQIIKIEDQDINSLIDLQQFLQEDQKQYDITIKRNNQLINTTLNLMKDKYNQNQHGLYLKEETIGIATITYYDPISKQYGALGHEISDHQGNIVHFDYGNCYDVDISNIRKSTTNQIGAKLGSIDDDQLLGNVTINSIYGIYGTLKQPLDGNLIEVASKDEIKLGKAYCFIEIANNKVKPYVIEITKIHLDHQKIKNIELKINDKQLIDQCGGIVQGMSGSPIVQNGKLIGAMTHVLSNDPTSGYGIFIENMLEAAG